MSLSVSRCGVDVCDGAESFGVGTRLCNPFRAARDEPEHPCPGPPREAPSEGRLERDGSGSACAGEAFAQRGSSQLRYLGGEGAGKVPLGQRAHDAVLFDHGCFTNAEQNCGPT
jgi:hypothetical protein